MSQRHSPPSAAAPPDDKRAAVRDEDLAAEGSKIHSDDNAEREGNSDGEGDREGDGEGTHDVKERYALLYAQDLTKVYRLDRGLFRQPLLVRALDSVSFYLRHRETLGIVGESGCGKSTLGRCLLRLIEPTVGRIVFDRKEVTALSSTELRALRRRMQIVFQDPYASLDPLMNVRQIIREGIEIFALADNRDAANAHVDTLLERVGLSGDIAPRYPYQLSGGQRQRVAIARALAVKPDMLVLDEPTSALDLPVQAQILNLLLDLQADLGLAMVFISHDLRVVQYISHRTAVMYLGRIVEIGPTHAVMSKRYHPYTRALFGAMPKRIDGRDKQLKMVPEGQPPSALAPPPGCAFFQRCPSAEAGICDVKVPALKEPHPGQHHRVACWYPEL